MPCCSSRTVPWCWQGSCWTHNSARASTSTESAIFLARYQALGCPTADPEPCLAHLEAFVTDVYLAALGRMPDASEVAYWVDVLTTEPTPDTVRGMLHVVFDGPEFRQRPVNPWQYVEALYQAMLGREPEPGGVGLVGAGGPGSFQHAPTSIY